MAKSTVGDLKVTNVTQSKPFKKNGVAQVAVLFELSDGQTMTILLHNPDSTPAKIAPTDNLTSWKWLLNKRDVSVVVQPKQGENVQMPVLAARMLKIATQNSARFKRTQGKRLEVEQTITDTQTRIQEKQGQLQALNNEIQALQGQIDEGLKAKPIVANEASTEIPDWKLLQAGENTQNKAKIDGNGSGFALKASTSSPNSRKPDLTYVLSKDGFSEFWPETPAGEVAWGEMYEFALKLGFDGKGIPTFGPQITKYLLKQLRSAGYRVLKGKLENNPDMTDDELMAELGIGEEQNQDQSRDDGYTLMTTWDSAEADAALAAQLEKSGERGAAARQFFKDRLQGMKVPTAIGEVRLNSGSKSKMTQTANREPVYLAVARVPEILMQGETGAFVADYKDRQDNKEGFYPFTHWLDFPDQRVLARIKVAQNSAGLLAYYLTAKADHVMMDDIADNKKAQLLSLLASNQRLPTEGVSTELYDSSKAEDDGEINIEILEVVKKPVSKPTNPDRDYLQSVIDGKEDLSDGQAVEAELERIGENLTPELEAMFEKAVDAYAAYQVQQASKIA